MAEHAQVLVDSTDVLKTFTKFSAVMPEFMREGLIESMDYVGQIAVKKYMYARKVTDKATGKVEGRRGVMEKLGIVSSDLMRSLQDKEGSRGKESIRRVLFMGENIVAVMGSKTPYAAIHEYGGRAGRNLASTIPARPYLNPAVEDSQTAIFRKLKLKLELTIKAAEGVI